ncbi:AtpZ/AtpI family protein [Fodinibius saliphilus]|uniref:AtpZ/AtpI family protein n=1 Tax=Fodinibius saliphilus TaxID=1920650 RepID=UPI001109E268|nr:AtpZ/AtpI family protein [Fodinibius saliphilus]
MDTPKNPGNYMQYLSLGGEIAAALAVPIFLGYWLDSFFESSPWLLLVGCLVGVINIFILIFKLNDRLNKQ